MKILVKKRTICVRQCTLQSLDPDLLSRKLAANKLPSDTQVYVKCDETGTPVLHGGHYSIYPISSEIFNGA